MERFVFRKDRNRNNIRKRGCCKIIFPYSVHVSGSGSFFAKPYDRIIETADKNTIGCAPFSVKQTALPAESNKCIHSSSASYDRSSSFSRHRYFIPVQEPYFKFAFSRNNIAEHLADQRIVQTLLFSFHILQQLHHLACPHLLECQGLRAFQCRAAGHAQDVRALF